MDLQLSGKLALVSGSTKGIGLAIATVLAREGAEVIVNGRSEASLAHAIEKISESVANAKLLGFAGDLSDATWQPHWSSAFPTSTSWSTTSASSSRSRSTRFPTKTGAASSTSTCCRGVRLARAYLAGMKRHDWGRIVFISSESGIQIPQEMIHYGMTKTAQLAVSRGIAETCAGTGVTCNAVLPGPTHSDGVEEFVAKLSRRRAVRRVRTRVLQERPANVAAQALRHHRGSRQPGRLRLQPAVVGDQRRRAARGRRRRAGVFLESRTKQLHLHCRIPVCKD